MPIDYKEYHPDWKAISLRIRTVRAGNKCEWCGVRNRTWWVLWGEKEGWECINDTVDEELYDVPAMASEYKRQGYKVREVVLTVAHIDHDKTNNDDANLAALCQRCHLNHDRKQHAENRRNGRNWKRDQLSIFGGK